MNTAQRIYPSMTLTQQPPNWCSGLANSLARKTGDGCTIWPRSRTSPSYTRALRPQSEGNTCSTNLSADASFARQATRICFFGHTHVPVAFIRDTVVRGGTYARFRVERGKQYFVNPG